MLNSIFQNDKAVKNTQIIKEILFPRRCLFCFREGNHLCKDHRKIPEFCGTKKPIKFLDELIIACDYKDNQTKKIVEHLKFKNFQDLSKTMGTEIFKRLIQEKSQEFFSEFVIIPIPLHWTRKLWRGFNQSEILAKELQKYLKIPINMNLKRIKRTKQQARLKKEGRTSNLDGAFMWMGKKIPGKILLIDDVSTTGSTLEAAANTLKQAGAKEVVGVVFAGGK